MNDHDTLKLSQMIINFVKNKTETKYAAEKLFMSLNC